MRFTGQSGMTCAQPGERHALKRRPEPCPPSGSRIVGSSLRRGIGDRGIVCFMLVDAGSTTEPVVDDHRVGGCQGDTGRPTVMAARQEISSQATMRPQSERINGW
jgi:hypothetical protein